MNRLEIHFTLKEIMVL